jgi:tetratricopeptide (TPR) repeat protein
MKTTERHHLKDNELALALGQAQSWAGDNSRNILILVALIVIVGGAALGIFAWRNNNDDKARTMLAEAMVIEEARIMPPGPPPGTTNDPTAIGGQVPGTYPAEQAKLEAALPKFQAAADAYPSSEPGQTARFHVASTLVALGKFDEAIKAYDQVIAGGNPLLARSARLGKAEAQLRASQFDPAIATFKQIVDGKEAGLPPEAMLMELARAYKLAGKTDEARKTWTQLVEQHADTPYAAEARAELEKLKS